MYEAPTAAPLLCAEEFGWRPLKLSGCVAFGASAGFGGGKYG
jgi:hypothetical protein